MNTLRSRIGKLIRLFFEREQGRLAITSYRSFDPDEQSDSSSSFFRADEVTENRK
jgi:hypothetical protein